LPFDPALIVFPIVGELPSFNQCRKLTGFYCQQNKFTGTLIWSDVYPVIHLNCYCNVETGPWIGLLKPRGCAVDLTVGMQLTSDTSEVQDATKLDYSSMGLKGECWRMYVPLYKLGG